MSVCFPSVSFVLFWCVGVGWVGGVWLIVFDGGRQAGFGQHQVVCIVHVPRVRPTNAQSLSALYPNLCCFLRPLLAVVTYKSILLSSGRTEMPCLLPYPLYVCCVQGP